MKNIIISALDRKSGKTVAGYAIAKLANKKTGYMKPIGSNVLYRDKKVLDYDAILFKEAFSLPEDAEELCMGMHHSKILHFYQNVKKELTERHARLSKGKELFLIEGGEFLWKGASLSLDALSLVEILNAEIVFVVAGEYHEILDELQYIHRINKSVSVKGIILNKMRDEDMERIKEDAQNLNLKLLGVIPYMKRLQATRVRHVVETLFAKVVAGEDGLDRYIENVFIAALSAPEIKRHPDYRKENKLIITGGDRSDVITACLEEGTSAIILTNNIVPSANILAQANEKNIPLISLRPDTYTVSKLIENIQPVILPDEREKLHEIEKEAREHLDIQAILD